MPDALAPAMLEQLRLAAARSPGLELLMLFGSRARGDAHPRSDWDFGYLAQENTDTAGLLALLVEAIGTDCVDLVDLRRAGGVLRFRAARDGVVIYEREPGTAGGFRLEAAHFWCDMASVMGPAHEDVLARLDR